MRLSSTDPQSNAAATPSAISSSPESRSNLAGKASRPSRPSASPASDIAPLKTPITTADRITGGPERPQADTRDQIVQAQEERHPENGPRAFGLAFFVLQRFKSTYVPKPMSNTGAINSDHDAT